jgi:hypothetical protein
MHTYDILQKFIDAINNDDEKIKMHGQTYDNYKAFKLDKIKLII